MKKSGWTLDTLKEYFESRLASQDRETRNAFAASEKAIVKAEDAQKEYNIRSNEFRSTLDDQNKEMIRRTEVSTMMVAMNERVDRQQEEIIVLRGYTTRGEGRDEALSRATSQRNWIVVLLVTAGLTFTGMLVTIIIAFRK